ncbi:hypothetical protein EV421DRAFT_1854566 [Armillaria borealis]|uniref:CDR ABC transporter domain-containing protein n=1 Tax=Armillaria borealis TaxID=47425 RepID=A0AA39MDW5_9AGAR|nr:hypothetical protein EV421DRAFT_1854566 [Armillaria borealis]
MTNKFCSINGSFGSLVPRGDGNKGISLDNQLCPVVGAHSCQAFVDGIAFTYLSVTSTVSMLTVTAATPNIIHHRCSLPRLRFLFYLATRKKTS